MNIPIRWADNTASLVANLKQGLQQIEATRAGAEKLASSLKGDNFIAQAHRYAAAMAQIGDASKLTAANQERVNVVMTRAVDVLKASGQGGSDLAKHFQSLADQTEKTVAPGERLTAWLGKANNLLGVFGVSLGATALIGFGKSLLADADALVKMSDRTGIAIEGLQRLQIAGDDAGNSIEEMSSAINQMQNRLASGDKSAVGALDRLGITLAEIKRLSPDEQFIRISDAIRQIQDPAQQVQIAMDLFGRTGASVLPTLKRGFDDVKDAAVGMSEETARAMDEAGDTIDRWWRLTKGRLAEAIVGFAELAAAGFSPAQRAANKAAEDFARLNAEIDKFVRRQIPGLKPQGFLPTPFAPSDPDSSVNAGIASALDADTRKKIAEATRRLTKDTGEATTALRVYRSALLASIEGESDLRVETLALADAFRLLGPPIYDILPALNQTNDRLMQAPEVWSQMGDEIDAVRNSTEAAERQTRSFASFLKSELGPAILSAIQGGGNIAKSIGGTIGGFLTSSKSVIGQGISNLVGKVGGTFGGVLGSVIPGLGTMLGSLAGSAVGNLFGKLFGGVSEDVKKARAMVEDFEKAVGSAATATQKAEAGGQKWKLTVIAVRDAYIATGRSAAEAERDVAAMWDSSRRGAEAARAAIDRVQQALDEANADQARAKELVEEYNIRTEDMGRSWNQAQLNEKVRGLMNDFRIMVQVLGMNAPDALRLMEGKFNDLVKVAQETGLEIPANLKPVLQQMVDLGTLVDKDGNKVTDLKSLGITFAETFAQSVDRLIQRFDAFIDKLFGVADAVDKIPDQKTIGIDFDVTPPKMPTIVDGDSGFRFPAAESFARGSFGFRDFGAGTPAILHGVEAVVPANQAGLGTTRVVQITMGDVVIPPGTSPTDQVAHAETLQRVLRFDVLGTLTAFENTIDKRIALSAGAAG